MQRSLAAKIWCRRFLEVIFFCVLWIPVVLTGIGNIREQTGHGHGEAWNTIGAKLSGWGLWLVGVVIWYIFISAIGSLILQKLRLRSRQD